MLSDVNCTSGVLPAEGSIHGPLAGYIEMFLVEGKPNETARRLSELNKLLLLQGDVQSQDKMFNNVKDWMSEMSVKNKYELPAKVAQQLAQAGYSEMVIRDKDLRAFWDFNCWLLGLAEAAILAPSFAISCRFPSLPLVHSCFVLLAKAGRHAEVNATGRRSSRTSLCTIRAQGMLFGAPEV